MSRKHIVALAVTVLAVSLAVLVSQTFDLHDTKPFPVDPELPCFLFGSLVGFCIGIAALTVYLVGSFPFDSELLPFSSKGQSLRSMVRRQAFEAERLLFSPPLSVLSLRI